MPLPITVPPPRIPDWSTQKRKKKKKNSSNIVRTDPWNLVAGRQTVSTYVTYDTNLGRFKTINK
jgi:hypothetical protein